MSSRASFKLPTLRTSGRSFVTACEALALACAMILFPSLQAVLMEDMCARMFWSSDDVPTALSMPENIHVNCVIAAPIESCRFRDQPALLFQLRRCFCNEAIAHLALASDFQPGAYAPDGAMLQRLDEITDQILGNRNVGKHALEGGLLVVLRAQQAWQIPCSADHVGGSAVRQIDVDDGQRNAMLCHQRFCLTYILGLIAMPFVRRLVQYDA